MKLSRTRPVDWLVALGGIALIALLFADWYGGESGWAALTVTDVLVALLALVAIAVPFVAATQKSGALPVATASFATIAGLIATPVLAIRLAVPPNGASLDTGAWLGFAAALVWTTAAAFAMRDERRGQPAPPTPEQMRTLPAPPAHGGGEATA